MIEIKVYKKNVEFPFIKIKPGDWVVIKPNLVKEFKETDPNKWQSVIITNEILIQFLNLL